MCEDEDCGCHKKNITRDITDSITTIMGTVDTPP